MNEINDEAVEIIKHVIKLAMPPGIPSHMDSAKLKMIDAMCREFIKDNNL